MNNDSEEVANRISWMKAEVSAALEGIEECVYLKGFLHEVLLYTKHVAPTEGASSDSPDWETVKEKLQRPHVTNNGELGNMLPLGLKPLGHIEKENVKNGREEEKTPREIGQARSQVVGPYQFERIRF